MAKRLAKLRDITKLFVFGLPKFAIGSIDVTNVHTSARIGAQARINCGVTCATNVAGAHVEQSVRVAAANQYHELGIAASLAIGGSAGVAVPVGVRVANDTGPRLRGNRLDIWLPSEAACNDFGRQVLDVRLAA